MAAAVGNIPLEGNGGFFQIVFSTNILSYFSKFLSVSFKKLAHFTPISLFGKSFLRGERDLADFPNLTLLVIAVTGLLLLLFW